MRITEIQKNELKQRAAKYGITMSEYVRLYLFNPERLYLKIEEINIL
jgi:antitoxin component of RelBE/YafQ-DinJ toxin-antitoxin module